MNKEHLIRFGVSFPAPLIEQFDRFIRDKGYTNRSEAIRDLVRKAILESSPFDAERHVAGTIVMVYDHGVRELPTVLTDIQHRFHHTVISAMHIHLNHAQCLEIVAVRGKLADLRTLHHQIQVQKGVFYAELSVTFVDDAGLSPHKHE